MHPVWHGESWLGAQHATTQTRRDMYLLCLDLLHVLDVLICVGFLLLEEVFGATPEDGTRASDGQSVCITDRHGTVGISERTYMAWRLYRKERGKALPKEINDRPPYTPTSDTLTDDAIDSSPLDLSVPAASMRPSTSTAQSFHRE